MGAGAAARSDGEAAGAGRAGRMAGRLAALLVIPALLLAASLGMRASSGPPWLASNLDPAYMYLFNALNVANLHRPWLVEHPGTPISLLGGAVIRARHLASPEEDVARAVIDDPGGHLELIGDALLALVAASLVVGGAVVAEATGSLGRGLLAQAVPAAFSGTIVPEVIRVQPEPLLLCVAVLAAALLVRAAWCPGDGVAREAEKLGVLVGLGMAAKLTFAPLLLAPAVALGAMRARAVFAASLAVSFVVFSLPVLFPPQVNRLFGWFFRMLTREGHYGAGAVGVVDPGRYLVNVYAVLAQERLFTLLLAASGFVLAMRVAEHGIAGLRDPRYRLLAAVTLAECVQLAAIAKQPIPRYLIPVLGLSVANAVVLGDLLAGGAGARSPSLTPARLRALGAIALVAVAAYVAPGLARRAALLGRVAQEQLNIHAVATRRNADRPLVNLNIASWEPSALYHGLMYNGRRYGDLLYLRYPDYRFYDMNTRRLSTFRALDAGSPAELGEFALWGWNLDNPVVRDVLPKDFLPPGATIGAIAKGRGEAVYLVRAGDPGVSRGRE